MLGAKMRKNAGISLLEMMVVLVLGTMLSYISFVNLRKFSNPAINAAASLSSYIKGIRQQALLSTRAYKITPISSTQARASYATSCSSTSFTVDSTTTFKMPSGSALSSTSWSVCYSPRGLSPSSVNIIINDSSKTKTVQVALGGAVRIL